MVVEGWLMEEITAYRQQLLSALLDVVNDVTRVVKAFQPADWNAPPRLGTSSPHYTLSHLRELEIQVFYQPLHRFLIEDTPQLLLFDDVSWLAENYDPAERVTAILDEFSNLRRLEVDWLRALPAQGWSRTARHPWWGVRTLQWRVELQLDVSHQHLRELTARLSM
jgi:hypothetical protein